MGNATGAKRQLCCEHGNGAGRLQAALYPVVCTDGSRKQLIAETKVPIPASPGEVAKHVDK